MGQDSRRRNAKGTGFHSAANDLRDRLEFRVCRFGFERSIPHHIGTNRRVGHLGSYVEHELPLLERIEVFRKALPAPYDPLREGGSGNILDAFHLFDQRLFLAGPDGGKSDAAVPHDDRRHAMPTRGREFFVPRRLSVIVRMHIDEARRDELPNGIDRLAGPDVLAR